MCSHLPYIFRKWIPFSELFSKSFTLQFYGATSSSLSSQKCEIDLISSDKYEAMCVIRPDRRGRQGLNERSMRHLNSPASNNMKECDEFINNEHNSNNN